MSNIPLGQSKCTCCEKNIAGELFGEHEAIHYRYGKKFATCDFELCRYSSQSHNHKNLQTHRKNHILPAPYLCGLCPQKFEKGEELLSHCRREDHGYDLLVKDIHLRCLSELKRQAKQRTRQQNPYPAVTSSSSSSWNVPHRPPQERSTVSNSARLAPDVQPKDAKSPARNLKDLPVDLERTRAVLVAPTFLNLPNYIFGLGNGKEVEKLAFEVVNIICLPQGSHKVLFEKTNEGPDNILGKETSVSGVKRKVGRPPKVQLRTEQELLKDKTRQSFLLLRATKEYKIETWLCLPENPNAGANKPYYNYFVIQITPEELTEERDRRNELLESVVAEPPFRSFCQEFTERISSLLFPHTVPLLNQPSEAMLNPAEELLNFFNTTSSQFGRGEYADTTFYNDGVSTSTSVNVNGQLGLADNYASVGTELSNLDSSIYANGGSNSNYNAYPLMRTSFNIYNTNHYTPNLDYNELHTQLGALLPDIKYSLDYELGTQLYSNQEYNGCTRDTSISSFNPIPVISTHSSEPAPTVASVLQSLYVDAESTPAQLPKRGRNGGTGSISGRGNPISENTGQGSRRSLRRFHPYGSKPTTSTSHLGTHSHLRQKAGAETETYGGSSGTQPMYDQPQTLSMPVPRYELPQAMIQNINANTGYFNGFGQGPLAPESSNIDTTNEDLSFFFAG